MGWAPSVNAAISGLLQLLPQWPDLAGVDIRDGGQAPEESGTEAIFIGDTQQLDATNQPVENAVDYVASSEGMGSRERETFTIHCCAAVINGDGDYSAARVRAYAIAGAGGAAVAAHPDLVRAIQGRATFGGGSLKYVKGDYGIKAVVLFDIDVESYTTG